MRFAKWVFLVSGTYGVLLVTPTFFLEERTGRDYPPAITHPEYFYGFVGTVLALQLLYLLIGSDPVRYRPAMLVATFAKTSFAIAAPTLYFLGRTPASWPLSPASTASWPCSSSSPGSRPPEFGPKPRRGIVRLFALTQFKNSMQTRAKTG
jgi:hypothetical protein